MKTYNIGATRSGGEENLQDILPLLAKTGMGERSKGLELGEKLRLIAKNPSFALNNSSDFKMKTLERKSKKTVDFDKKAVKNGIRKKKTQSKNELLFEDKEKGLEYVVTKDRALLDQYYKLRNEIFHADRGWTGKEWLESDHDRNGHIIVTLDKKGKVIAGARLMVSTNGELLSGEIEGTEFVYGNLFSKLDLDVNGNRGEVDGLVVSGVSRDRMVTVKLLESCIEKALDSGCSYLVGIAFLPYCRLYKSAFYEMGYDKVYIARDFPWVCLEEYNYSRDFPIVVDIMKRKILN